MVGSVRPTLQGKIRPCHYLCWEGDDGSKRVYLLVPTPLAQFRYRPMACAYLMSRREPVDPPTFPFSPGGQAC